MNYLENLHTALRYWETIPKQNVAIQLSYWRQGNSIAPHTCDTIACFGGWLPAMPEFAAMGVKADKYTRPYLDVNGDRLRYSYLAKHLFNDDSLFDPTLLAEGNDDHAAVTKRLKDQIKMYTK